VYAPPQASATPLSQKDFLARREGASKRINELPEYVQQITEIHQRLLSSPDDRVSNQLEALVSQTQVLNSQIKDEIKFLEHDAARDPNNSFKKSQVSTLKNSFLSQLRNFSQEESNYSKRYKEAIARQYRIVNPDATDEQIAEVQNASWDEGGIFTQAVSSSFMDVNGAGSVLTN
jgi:syntaxin 1B/2/3